VAVGRRRRAIVAMAAAIFLAGSLAGWTLWPRAALDRADPAEPRLVALGEAVYRQHCASCHGARLEGQPDWRARKPDGRLPAPPHDESGHTWHHSDAQLFGLTKVGLKPPLAPAGYASDMPGFAGILSDEQIWAVISYIKSTWPPHIRDHQRRIDEAMRR
jgi:mono/diheme cytochrome c family protein